MAMNLSGGVSSRVASFLGYRLRSMVSSRLTDRAAAVLCTLQLGKYESGPVVRSDHEALLALLEHDLVRIELTSAGMKMASCFRPGVAHVLRASPYDFPCVQARAFACAATMDPFKVWTSVELSRAAGVNRRTATSALSLAISFGLFQDGLITQAGRHLLDVDEKGRP